MSNSVLEKELTAPQKYAKFPGNANLAYRDICQVLSARKDQVEWDKYTRDEWRLMGVMAETEGVGPLLYWNFKNGAWPIGMPEPLQNKLTQSYYNTLANNTILYEELDRILTALSEAEIPVILLKGAALAVTLYEDIGLRPMGDLDLLVPREEVGNAEKVLVGIGYGYIERPRLTSWFTPLIAYDVGLFGGLDGNVNVELHWNLIAGDTDLRSPQLEWFWEQVRPFGNGALLMEPTANLLYQSAHLMVKHGQTESRLIWFYDIYIVLQSSGENLDWESLVDHASIYNWSYALNITLKKLHMFFNISFIPPGIHQLLEDVSSQEAKLFVHRKNDLIQHKTVRDWNRLASMSWRVRVVYVVALLFPSMNFMRWRYKPSTDWLLPLYYPFRWVEILFDLSIVLIKSIFLQNQGTRDLP